MPAFTILVALHYTIVCHIGKVTNVISAAITDMRFVGLLAQFPLQTDLKGFNINPKFQFTSIIVVSYLIVEI